MVGFLSSYPAIWALLETLLADAKTILGEQWIGLYLHGSLAYGDFNQKTSDIDFLVITDGHLSAEIFLALTEMHARLFNSGLEWSQKLEGAYLPRADVRRHDPAHPPVPWLGVDGHFALETLGNDWVLQRWILREKGFIVSGPPLSTLIDPVTPGTLKEAVRASLREWWSPPFPSPERFRSDNYLAYAVLTMCRSLYVLEHGRIASKPEAARWALSTLEKPWKSLIQGALDGQESNTTDGSAGTFEFIRFTLVKAGILKEVESEYQ